MTAAGPCHRTVVGSLHSLLLVMLVVYKRQSPSRSVYLAEARRTGAGIPEAGIPAEVGIPAVAGILLAAGMTSSST